MPYEILIKLLVSTHATSTIQQCRVQTIQLLLKSNSNSSLNICDETMKN